MRRKPSERISDAPSRSPLKSSSASDFRDATQGKSGEEQLSGTSSEAGALFVVSTPIGNLDDITVRGLEVLRKADLIACEDTRKTRILLHRWNITSRLMSLHRFSESRKTSMVLELLGQGRNLALVSDAGTPAISDPGTAVVRAALDAGFQVVPIPGPSAVTAALSASGMDCSGFVYLGFAPRKDRQRSEFFKTILTEVRTSVFFETPRRILDSLAIAQQMLGNRRLVLFREITKIHEEIICGTAESVREALALREAVKGEIIVVVEGSGPRTAETSVDEAVRVLMEEGLSGKRLADEAHVRFGLKKGDAYRKFLEISGATAEENG